MVARDFALISGALRVRSSAEGNLTRGGCIGAAALTMGTLCLVLGLTGLSAVAQDGKGVRFWNLTLHTITMFRMSPAGAGAWGPDQCRNDRDGTVDHDERLRITDITPGRYDVQLEDNTGHRCIVRNIEVRPGAIFSIEERQLTDCSD